MLAWLRYPTSLAPVREVARSETQILNEPLHNVLNCMLAWERPDDLG